jgi:hypothetical protein
VINWFRKKFNSDRYEIVTSEVPVSTISRWYLYDTSLTEEINELAEMVGLSRISEEGEAKELEDSDLRIKHMSPLFPFLDAMSDLSSKTISSLHMQELIKNIPEDEREEVLHDVKDMNNVYKAVAMSTLIGTFSIALELGIISHNTVNADLMYLGDDDNE